MTELKEDLMFLLDEANSEFSLANFKAGGSLSYTEELGIMADLLIARGVMIPVRCKDCKHWHEETGWCYHHSHFVDSEDEACHPWESSNWKMLNANDFCSMGERKDNG